MNLIFLNSHHYHHEVTLRHLDINLRTLCFYISFPMYDKNYMWSLRRHKETLGGGLPPIRLTLQLLAVYFTHTHT